MLRVDNLSVSFVRRGDEPLPVLDRVSFDVKPGEFVSLVGPSGCGKTTLLRCVGGLHSPDAGTITIADRQLHGVDRRVALVFQSDSLFPWRNVMANIAFGLEVRRYPGEKTSTITRELVEIVGLGGFERALPHQLSGGMRQRVNLARALAVDPEVLLMDEPLGSLDMLTREQMQLEILRIWARNKKTVIFVTHQIEEAVFLSDRVLLMSRRPGRIRRDVAVDLGRPRDMGTRRTPAFHAIVDYLGEELSNGLAEHEPAGPRTDSEFRPTLAERKQP
ncbi:MAG TPA: ABC transporter ATP-binding protein [bacterium]|nr:ABC transporter ATP-binding protein [bacterium]